MNDIERLPAQRLGMDSNLNRDTISYGMKQQEATNNRLMRDEIQQIKDDINILKCAVKEIGEFLNGCGDSDE